MSKFMVLFLFIISNTASASKVIARVQKTRGKVTQLRPGSHIASKVKLNDRLIEDTSIVTGDKSFVSIVFDDKSRMNLGPNGMLVLKENDRQSKTNIVSLLKGKIRSQVKKKKKDTKNKLFIKTRTAAMGVRGTDFETIYNPESKNTSLLTFKGEVAMVKVDEKKLIKAKAKKARKIKPKSRGRKDIEIVEEVKDVSEKEILEEALESKDKVEVKAGQFSGTVQKLDKTSKPVKINPVQLTLLYQNAEFKEKSEKKLKKSKRDVSLLDTKKSEAKLLEQAPQEAPPQGFYNPKTGDYAPKAGGLIDLETGLYIPPEKDSDFDEKKGVFIPKKMGAVDKETGQYIPPKGIKLDAKEGFKVEESTKKGKKAKKKEKVLLAMTQDLNKTIAQDVVLGSVYDEKEIDIDSRMTNKETYTKDSVEVQMGFFSESLDYSNTEFNSDQKLESESARYTNFLWNLSSGTVFQPFITVGFNKVDYGTVAQAGAVQGSDNLIQISVGARYYLNKRWNVIARFMTEQEQYFRHGSTMASLERVALIRGELGARGLVWEKRKWAALVEGSGTLNPSKKKADMEVGMGLGVNLKGYLRYNFSPKYYLDAMGFWGMEKNSAEAPEFKSDVTRTSSGIGLQFGAFL